jgi:hypothetical protein
VLDALEQRYPMLCGTVRDHVTTKRRAFLRYFGCQQDLSFVETTTPLPELIVAGTEPFIIWGRIERRLRRQMMFLANVLLLPCKWPRPGNLRS